MPEFEILAGVSPWNRPCLDLVAKGELTIGFTHFDNGLEILINNLEPYTIK